MTNRKYSFLFLVLKNMHFLIYKIHKRNRIFFSLSDRRKKPILRRKKSHESVGGCSKSILAKKILIMRNISSLSIKYSEQTNSNNQTSPLSPPSNLDQTENTNVAFVNITFLFTRMKYKSSIKQ